MKRGPVRTITPNDENEALLEELEGFRELGMQEEVLRIVDRLLSKKPSSPRFFNKALHALLPYADKLDEWTERVESAYTAMSLRNSRMCRSAMLCFYHSLCHHQKSIEFIPARFLRSTAPMELAFALDAFVALRHVKRADALAPRCLRLLSQMDSCDEGNILLHSLADYFASGQDWGSAIALWYRVIDDEVLGPNAYVEIAAARTAQARQAIKEGLSFIDLLRKAAPDDLAITLPGNFKARLDEDEIEMILIKANLDQCFPDP